jgi:tetratricopeptide (TPR) repeat protein
MDPRQQEQLVQRLVRNPQDQGAIAEAHAAGMRDPEAYARLLEKIGVSTPEPSLSSHWLNEAANVWLTTFADPQRAANALLAAIDRDPLSEPIAKRLSELYRSNGDAQGLVGSIERRANAFAQLATREPDWLPRAAELYEEVGRLCAEPPLSDVLRAKAAFARAVDLDPTSQFAIYSLRELHKSAGEFNEALPYFGMEVALVTDAQRKLALFLDEVEVAKLAGRPERAQSALRQALKMEPADPSLRQQLATLTLERYRSGQSPADAERIEACELFVGLAEQYPGEHGFLYSLCALELVSNNERGMQLAIYFGEQLGRLAEVAPLAASYARDNPQGLLIGDARRVAGTAAPLPLPTAQHAQLHTAPQHSPQAHAQTGSRAAAQTAAADPSRQSGYGREAFVAPAHGAPFQATGGSVHPANPVPAGVSIDDLLERADQLAKKSRKNEAIAVYRQILDIDPINPDAIAYLQEQLSLKRKYAELRDVLLSAINWPESSDDDRLGWLREVAALSETQLRDLDGAIGAWQRVIEIDAQDEEGTDQLKRLLEKARRWDEFAALLEREAARTEDSEVRMSLERNLAKLHADKRKDPAAAGEAWARIAELSPGDETTLQEAVRWFESAGRGDRAADVIAAHVMSIDDDLAKRELYFKLGNLRASQGQALAAAEALAEGAEELGDAEMWSRAEGYFGQVGAWEPAANCADEQAKIAEDDEQRAAHIARAAGHLVQGGDAGEAITRLEQAVDLAPTHEPYANLLEELLVRADRVDEMVSLFLTRATKLDDTSIRMHLRKRAAVIQRDRMGDAAAARASFALVLEDAEDPDALEWLAHEAEERGDAELAIDYLARLVNTLADVPRKIDVSLRQAKLSAESLHDVARAAKHYEFVLRELDRNHEPTLELLGDLEIERGNFERGAEVLEQFFAITPTRERKLELATRLADIYEANLARPNDAIRLLNFVHSTDPDDLDATQRLCELAEAAGQWPLVAELMVELIAIEGEDEQVSEMTRRLARILHRHLENGAEALNVLGGVADQGDEPCRQAYIELGDQLGEKAVVARRIVAWYQNVAPSPARSDALHAAFERFVAAKQGSEAIAVAKDLSASDSANSEIAPTLEALAVAASDREALGLAHELRAEGLLGNELANERVRQAEVLAGMGVDPAEAVGHGELGLPEAEGEEVETLLARLAKLCVEASAKIDVYERHIARCEGLEARLVALGRTAEVAAELADLVRSGSLFEVALGGNLDDSALALLVDLVRKSDARTGSRQLTESLVAALSNAGQGARDGGRTRSRMLRMAASLAHTDLSDLDRAFQWLGDALLASVDDIALDALEALAGEANDYGRAEDVLTRALGEVFDGPLVRRLLGRRARLRKERKGDLRAASEDLKRLHELSPSDIEVSEQLSAVYEELGEHRGMVALLEDQILRNRDKEQRCELARRVAVIWEEQLKDAREAADAWRRVLRLLPGDEQAKQGLARAKEGMLEQRSHELPSSVEAAIEPPPPMPPTPPMPPAPPTSAGDARALPPLPGLGSQLPEASVAARNAGAGSKPEHALPERPVAEDTTSEAEARAAAEAEDPSAMAGEDEAHEALVDALRRSDLPPDDETVSMGHGDLMGLAAKVGAVAAADLDDFDTATEVTASPLAHTVQGQDEEGEVTVEDDLLEIDSDHPPEPKPKRQGSAAPPKPASRVAPPPRRGNARS